MTRPCDIDFRERAVAPYLDGDDYRSVGKLFSVAPSTVVKWAQRYRTTGSVAPGNMGGHVRPVLEPYRDDIREWLDRTPHLTLRELQDLLAARHGVKVSHQTVWVFLRRQGLRFKKSDDRQ